MRIVTGALIVAGLAFFLAAGSATLRGEAAGGDAVLMEGLPESYSGRYSVIVLFQSEDCASYENFLDALGALHRSGSVPVLGIPLDAPGDSGDAGRTVSGFDPGFPLDPTLADQAVALISRMGYRRTPLALVLDPRGRPLLVLPPHSVPYRQAEMTRVVVEYVANLQSGGAVQ